MIKYVFIVFVCIYVKIYTFGHVHGVHGAQQVPGIKAVSLRLTQPVVTCKVVPQVRPDYICYHHSVQKPAGAHSSVVMFNPRTTGQVSIRKKKIDQM